MRIVRREELIALVAPLVVLAFVIAAICGCICGITAKNLKSVYIDSLEKRVEELEKRLKEQ